MHVSADPSSFVLTYIVLDASWTHERLANRVVGRVHVVLEENRNGEKQEHRLTVRSWTDRRDEMSEADIELALINRASDIVARIVRRLENSQGVEAAPVPRDFSED
ncbi:hypothetical protein GCM10007989_14950 [Devosia pacifica]|uniref:Uncharacterized protein n=1 Tax=Devosia pacifica TaxID=1335967 RepID=A0A918S2K6_9HYPH|nr:hypothetical protein [Devosia pacifica]GHA20818.1 hypothetical protein GCM10007989_14950 [Devosia pacifica]